MKQCMMCIGTSTPHSPAASTGRTDGHKPLAGDLGVSGVGRLEFERGSKVEPVIQDFILAIGASGAAGETSTYRTAGLIAEVIGDSPVPTLAVITKANAAQMQ